MGTGEIPPQIYPASGIPSHSITVAFAHVWVAAGTSAASATAVSGFSVFFSGADADSGFAARNVTGSDRCDQTAPRFGVKATCRVANKVAKMFVRRRKRIASVELSSESSRNLVPFLWHAM